MFKIYFNENGISVRQEKEPVLVIDKNGIFVSDGLPSAEAVEEWITIKGTHIPLGEFGEQVGGPRISPYKFTKVNQHLTLLRDGEKVPASVEKAIGQKVPKGWKNVMVSHDPNKNLQVMGTDSKGRVHSLYTQKYEAAQAAKKWDRINGLLKDSSKLDATINSLKTKDRESYDCLKLIRETGIRPGSTRDTKAEKEAFGATTLQGRHVVQEGNRVFLRFVGKEGVNQNHEITDPYLKKTLVQRAKSAGEQGDLFKTNNTRLLKHLKPAGVITKDLRTLKANEVARAELAKLPKAKSVKELEKMRKDVSTTVSKTLGNKPEMSLNKYIAPHRFKEHSPEAYAEWEAKQNAKKGGK